MADSAVKILAPALAAAAVAALAAFGGRAALAGLLAGWLMVLGTALGGALWLLIGTLTGGEWTRSGRQALTALALSTPLAALCGLALLAALPQLYPWVSGPEAGSRAMLYLATVPFSARLVAILAVWSAIGLAAPRLRQPLPAALLLLLFAACQTFAATDWLLSRDPDFGSTAFPAALAVLQLTLAAAATCAMGLPAGRGGGDWGGLLLVCVLGSAYFLAMQYLVLWTGNLPADAAWFGRRAIWPEVAIALGGLVVPVAVLLPTRLRQDPAMLRRIAWPVLAAGLLQILAWAEPRPGAAGVAATLAAAALVALIAALAPRPDGRPRPPP